ncbi:LysR family transcriptional regulator [Roseovarius sp.]|uniref:LysR family transcriptional regulator n=1 Tax=Roseovarius sp. TaxID=1486281 RepID=UPI000C3BC441|nr:LysR family transcriptional regulator [Roseovarius sp.]MAZ21053.1 LysR family transcriptional regulator [Roseovarius sp.]|tara:strand:+ start:1085 stop:1999 length:915 start_codon:yes stop_codon:yes gene_type:complete
MKELKPIRIFLEVASQKSFAQAARNLRMTPASVTRIVARLEEDLEQQLLVRTTRQVALTSAGALVAARYRPIVEDFDRATEELERATQPERGSLSISAPMSFGLRLMPKLVDAFRLAYPNIELHINLADRLIDIVEENYDLAIRISAPPTDKSTIWRKICNVPRYVVASPRLFDRIERPHSPEDIDPKTCMSYNVGKEPEIWRFQKSALRRSVTAGTDIICNNGDALYTMATIGTGMALLPEFIIAQGMKAGAVEQVLSDWTIPPLWLAIYYPPYDALPPLVATFTDFFEAFLRDIDGFDFGDP